MRATDLLSRPLADALLRLATDYPRWMEWEDGPHVGSYVARVARVVPLARYLPFHPVTGADVYSLYAASRWIVDGPKTFRPTLEQCQALEQVAVNIDLEDYTQPYPVLLVKLPPGYEPFHAVMCHINDTGPRPMLAFTLHSVGNQYDVTTTVGRSAAPIEDSLVRFDPDCGDIQGVAPLVLRVAANSCLALTHYGCHAQYLFPHDVERDKHLAKESTERGERARGRVRRAEMLVAFRQEIQLHATTTGSREPGEAVGVEKSTHWRRGHWAMQVCGHGRTERKRIFRKPVLVRADLFHEDLSATSVDYHS